MSTAPNIVVLSAIKDQPLPKFLDDGASTKLLRAAREDLN